MNVCHQFYCCSNTAGHNCILISIFMTLGYVWGQLPALCALRDAYQRWHFQHVVDRDQLTNLT